ncbi:MAG: ABC transporter permease subunit, partial [Firmicutes bacterium]|nr:ABC transporter permease subunit [Bacillota bacterium]
MNFIFLESGPFAIFKWQALFNDIGLFLQGFKYTFFISFCALLLAIFIGLLFGIILTSNLKFCSKIIKIYLEFIHNTPLLIQILFLFNFLPLIGVKLNITLIGILGVGIYHGSYTTEVIRSGIMSIDKCQFEAASSQGFNFWQSMFY